MTDIDETRIQTMVGDEMRVIPMDLFLDMHQQLADEYRQLGLSDQLLDLAIVANMPRRLAEVLDGASYH